MDCGEGPIESVEQINDTEPKLLSSPTRKLRRHQALGDQLGHRQPGRRTHPQVFVSGKGNGFIVRASLQRKAK